LGYEVVAMKEIYRDIAHPAFAYCQKHNRLFAHYTVGWLTPAYPERLITFQALCDICKETLCNSVPNSPNKFVLDVSNA
jgi:hypothetical protein